VRQSLSHSKVAMNCPALVISSYEFNDYTQYIFCLPLNLCPTFIFLTLMATIWQWKLLSSVKQTPKESKKYNFSFFTMIWILRLERYAT
jgi:hypothetical protein